MWADVLTKPKQGKAFCEFHARLMNLQPDTTAINTGFCTCVTSQVSTHDYPDSHPVSFQQNNSYSHLNMFISDPTNKYASQFISHLPPPLRPSDPIKNSVFSFFIVRFSFHFFNLELIKLFWVNPHNLCS